jgi:hypothetical protein
MSLPLLHAGRTNPGLSAALDLRFALDKSLTAYRGPTPSFSRASSGTYFGSDGLLKYANVNLLQYSEQFDNAYWAAIASTVTQNTTASPTGSNTADSLFEASGVNYHGLFPSSGISVNIGQSYTLSAYVKKGNRKYFAIGYGFNGGLGSIVQFDLDSATTVYSFANGGYAVVSSSATDVGNGWIRISAVLTSNTATVYPTFINTNALFTTGNIHQNTYSGDPTKFTYIWGAQLEIGSTPGTYVPTTNAANSAPRFDHVYNGTSWISRGLLVEEQRTNLCYYSEDFSNAAWAKVRMSVTANNAVAPDGTTTADLVYPNTTGAYSSIGITLAAVTNSTKYTTTVYLKSAGKTWGIVVPANGSYSAWFNLSNGTVGYVHPNSTATIQNVGNGWYRCSVTTTTVATAGYVYVQVADADGLSDVTASGTNGILAWGAQLELGSFATSYTPSLSNSSTVRSADVCQITGGDFSSFWNASEGSFAVEYDKVGNKTGASVTTVVFGTSNSNSTPYEVYYEDYNGTEYYRDFNGSSQFQIATSPSAAPNTTVRIAGCYKANDVAVSRNGNAVLTDTSVTLFGSQTTLTIGDITAGQWPVNGHIARLRYFNKRLTDKQLEDLCRPEDQLKIDLKFSENLSLTPVVGPTPSFSRASAGTYFNSSGVLSGAAINEPRFDYAYDGTSWISKGLLIEEQRTNLILRSNRFNAVFWSIGANRGTVTQNAISPVGFSNAWTAECTTTSANGFYLQQTGIPAASGTYTFSIFAKKGNNGFIAAQPYDSSGSYALVYFNLNTGTSGNVTSSGYTGISHGMINCGNGWYRCYLTFTKPNSNALEIYPSLTTNGMGDYGCTSGQTNLIFGSQIELGAFPTSVIETATSATTRSADVCQITGADFSGFYNQSEGSFAVEYDILYPSNPDKILFAASTSGNSSIYYSDVGNSYYVVYNSGVQAQLSPGSQPASNTTTRIALCYKANDFAVTRGGAAVVTDTSGNIPTVNRLDIGDQLGSYKINGHISRLRYYAIRLPNRLLIAKSQ